MTPPPRKFFPDAPTIEIVPTPVPAVVVKLVGKELLNEPFTTSAPPLNVMFLTPDNTTNERTVIVLPLRLIVPFVKFADRNVPNVKASASVMVPPTASYVMGELIVTPFVVTVGLPVNVINPVADHVMPTPSVNDDPDTPRVPVPAKVGVLLDPRKAEQFKAPERVTVYALVALELLKKFTVSAVVGTEAPTVAAFIDWDA